MRADAWNGWLYDIFSISGWCRNAGAITETPIKCEEEHEILSHIYITSNAFVCNERIGKNESSVCSGQRQRSLQPGARLFLQTLCVYTTDRGPNRSRRHGCARDFITAMGYAWYIIMIQWPLPLWTHFFLTKFIGISCAFTP